METSNSKRKRAPRRSLLGLPEKVSGSPILDFFIGFFGVCLAAVSAWFPWYVHNNADEFGPPRMVFDGQRNPLPGADPRLRDVAGTLRPIMDGVGLDTTTTGSVPQPSTRLRGRQMPLGETAGNLQVVAPPVGPPSYRIVFAVQGRALLRDGDDLIPVARGAKLPDGSQVESIRKKNGFWELHTSSDQTIRWRQ